MKLGALRKEYSGAPWTRTNSIEFLNLLMPPNFSFTSNIVSVLKLPGEVKYALMPFSSYLTYLPASKAEGSYAPTFRYDKTSRGLFGIRLNTRLSETAVLHKQPPDTMASQTPFPQLLADFG